MAPTTDELPPATQRAVAFIRAHPNQPRELTDAQLAENGYLQSTRAQAWSAVARRPSRWAAWDFRRLVRAAVTTAVIFPIVWIVSFVALSFVWGLIREFMRQTGVPEDATRNVTGLLAIGVVVLATVVAYRVTRRGYHRFVATDRPHRSTIGR